MGQRPKQVLKSAYSAVNGALGLPGYLALRVRGSVQPTFDVGSEGYSDFGAVATPWFEPTGVNYAVVVGAAFGTPVVGRGLQVLSSAGQILARQSFEFISQLVASTQALVGASGTPGALSMGDGTKVGANFFTLSPDTLGGVPAGGAAMTGLVKNLLVPPGGQVQKTAGLAQVPLQVVGCESFGLALRLL